MICVRYKQERHFFVSNESKVAHFVAFLSSKQFGRVEKETGNYFTDGDQQTFNHQITPSFTNNKNVILAPAYQ
jgi:hypothetical protein